MSVVSCQLETKEQMRGFFAALRMTNEKGPLRMTKEKGRSE